MPAQRDQLAAMLQQAAEDQDAALQEFVDLLKGPEALEFLTKIKNFHDRTVPGNHFEQMFSALINNFINAGTSVEEFLASKSKIVSGGQTESALVVEQPAI